MTIIVNGIRVNYELVGEGECLTLIHGAGEHLWVWEDQISFFSRYYKVLAYDVRGHGETERPESEFSIEACVEDLYALLTALNVPQTFLLGHSMGGRIALHFTLSYPNMVRGLILSSSVGSGPKGAEIARMIESFQSGDPESAVNERIGHVFSPGFSEKKPEALRRYRSVLLKNPASFIYAIRSKRPPDEKLDMSKISCPVLIIVGTYDHVCSVSAGEMTQRRIPGSQMRVFPTGHVPFVEEPEEYNRTVLDFLRSLPTIAACGKMDPC
jgi:pimeloyl-ACP methyl ester carboxylesterase